MVLIAVVVYLLRYVWRVLLFGASYQLAVELREDYYRQLSRQHPEFYLRHRTGDLMLVRLMTSIASCLPPEKGC